MSLLFCISQTLQQLSTEEIVSAVTVDSAFCALSRAAFLRGVGVPRSEGSQDDSRAQKEKLDMFCFSRPLTAYVQPGSNHDEV